MKYRDETAKGHKEVALKTVVSEFLLSCQLYLLISVFCHNYNPKSEALLAVSPTWYFPSI
jgi:hypothetical protein